jgi:cellulose synthase/poly-beta-1,6-N-acetylglucosamine synthase-like glycosyltransferase
MTSWRDIITLGILFLSLYFEVFLLITYFERRHVMHWRVRRSVSIDHKNNHELPGVTIIVPCYNEEKTAIKTIESLLALDYPSDKLHILVINDGSTDDTLARLQVFENEPRVQIVTKENGGKHSVLNMGIAMAHTELVGCLDADSYVKSDALLRIIKKFKTDENIMAVVPSLHVHDPKTPIQKMQKVEYLIGVFMRSILAEINALYVTPGPFSIFKKSIFEKIGMYKKAHNTEDMEMALRMQKGGYKIACAHDAVVYTSSPNTPKKLYKQRVRWTSGFLANVKDYRKIMFNQKHGHIGNFILPFMIVSTVSTILVVLMFFYGAGKYLTDLIVNFRDIGFRIFEFSWPTFDLFFVETSPLVLAGLFAIILVITFILIGSRLSNAHKPKLSDMVWYMIIYSFISPFWVIKSVINLIFSKQAVWR